MSYLPPPPPPGQSPTPPPVPPVPPPPGPPYHPPVYPSTPPPKRGFSKTMIGISACSALFVIIVIAAAVAPKDTTKTANKGSTVPSAQSVSTTAAPTTVPTTAAPTTTLPPTTTTTRAPTTTTTSKTQAMSEWATTAVPKMEAAQEHMTEMSGYTDIDDLPKMARSCRLWQSDLADLRSVLPSPDAGVTAAMTAGLDDFDQAAELCIEGATEFDASAMSQAASYVNKGAVHFNEATAALGRI